MKIKTSELTGAALDWAVCRCEGLRHVGNYAKSWRHCGPIIEREKIRLDTTWNQEDGNWSARMDTVGGWWLGDTPLIAAMRCYVASKLGDTVDVPDELT